LPAILSTLEVCSGQGAIQILVQFNDHEKDGTEHDVTSISQRQRQSRLVLIAEATTNESIYALTVGCCGEPQPGMVAYNYLEPTDYGLVDSFQGGVIHAVTTQYSQRMKHWRT